MHTKGKWVHQKAVSGCSEQIYAPDAGDGNGALITTINSGLSPEENAANAERICLCHNYFDDLMDACDNTLHNQLCEDSLRELLREIRATNN